mgnify:CR=1 FL=1|jgi:hypothetical protein
MRHEKARAIVQRLGVYPREPTAVVQQRQWPLLCWARYGCPRGRWSLAPSGGSSRSAGDVARLHALDAPCFGSGDAREGRYPCPSQNLRPRGTRVSLGSHHIGNGPRHTATHCDSRSLRHDATRSADRKTCRCGSKSECISPDGTSEGSRVYSLATLTDGDGSLMCKSCCNLSREHHERAPLRGERSGDLRRSARLLRTSSAKDRQHALLEMAFRHLGCRVVVLGGTRWSHVS